MNEIKKEDRLAAELKIKEKELQNANKLIKELTAEVHFESEPLQIDPKAITAMEFQLANELWAMHKKLLEMADGILKIHNEVLEGIKAKQIGG